jgi:hypothetical protein
MCDYSLEEYLSRDARIADHLVTRRFKKYDSIGLVDPQLSNVAVCLRPGTELLLSGIPQLFQEQFGVGTVAQATFEQRELPPKRVSHRDGVRFRDSNKFVLLQDMDEKVGVTVLTIPAKEPIDTVVKKKSVERELVDA